MAKRKTTTEREQGCDVNARGAGGAEEDRPAPRVGRNDMAISISVDRRTVADYFDGVMVKVYDPEIVHPVPGWKCKVCGWQIGCKGLPPAHLCPDDGNEQNTVP